MWVRLPCISAYIRRCNTRMYIHVLNSECYSSEGDDLLNDHGHLLECDDLLEAFRFIRVRIVY